LARILAINTNKYFRSGLLVSVLVAGLALCHEPSLAGSPTPTPNKERDGQHDFDFHIGNWKTHLWRRIHPLTGSNTWVEYDGTTVVRKVWQGRANLVELVADGEAGHFEGLSLRLYNPESRQWSLNFASINNGTLGQPTIANSGMRAVSFSTRRR
jgi:hypothetical protein